MTSRKQVVTDVDALAEGLSLGTDGIWYSSESPEVSYPSGGNDMYSGIEDSSFWFQHRNACIIAAVRAYPPADGRTVVDIGGGNGFVAAALGDAGFEVVLVEPGRDGARNAKRRGVETVICASAASARLRDRSPPATGLFDVVEHIRDDVGFLTDIRAKTQHGGRLFVTVPAYAFLWSAEDKLAGHFRRYSLDGIRAVIGRAGFDVEFASYIFRWLPLPVALLRALPYRLGLGRTETRSEDVARDHVVRNNALARILAAASLNEIERLAAGKAMPFGGSCLIVATAR